jgi:hypothetical protein
MVGPFDPDPLCYEEADSAPVPKFIAVSLHDLLKKGVPEPVFLAEMLYEGGLHCIAGAPDSGKTTIALAWAVAVMKQGRHVAFFDEEGGSEIVAEKLIALGANADDLDHLTYVPFPGRTWTDNDAADLMTFMREINPAMALWDSSAGFLARAGLDENSASDVTNWWSRILAPLARVLGTAIVVIDHDTKSSEQSRYARGSGAKLAGLDVQFKVEIVKPFTRDENGVLKLVVSKDRRGYLHRDWRIQVRTGNGIVKPLFNHDNSVELTEEVQANWGPGRKLIWEALSDEYLTWQQINDKIVARSGNGLRRETGSTKLNEMLAEGLVERGDPYAAGGAARWRKPARVSGNTPVSEGVTNWYDEEPNPHWSETF